MPLFLALVFPSVKDKIRPGLLDGEKSPAQERGEKNPT